MKILIRYSNIIKYNGTFIIQGRRHSRHSHRCSSRWRRQCNQKPSTYYMYDLIECTERKWYIVYTMTYYNNTHYTRCRVNVLYRIIFNSSWAVQLQLWFYRKKSFLVVYRQCAKPMSKAVFKVCEAPGHHILVFQGLYKYVHLYFEYLNYYC